MTKLRLLISGLAASLIISISGFGAMLPVAAFAAETSETEVTSETAAAASADAWDDSVYRVADFTNTLKKTQLNRLDGYACDFVKEYNIDLVILVVNSTDIGDNSLKDYAGAFFRCNNYGCGDAKNGIVCAFAPDTKETAFYYSGDIARGTFTPRFEKVCGKVMSSLYESKGLYDALYAFIYDAIDYMENPESYNIKVSDIKAESAAEESAGTDTAAETESASDGSAAEESAAAGDSTAVKAIEESIAASGKHRTPDEILNTKAEERMNTIQTVSIVLAVFAAFAVLAYGMLRSKKSKSQTVVSEEHSDDKENS